jgi:hypothetical protein
MNSIRDALDIHALQIRRVSLDEFADLSDVPGAMLPI